MGRQVARLNVRPCTNTITGPDPSWLYARGVLRPTDPDVRGLLKFPFQNVLLLASCLIVVTIRV
jgi:hypothetical protein